MKVNKTDLDFLYTLYRMRCLTTIQIYENFYKNREYSEYMNNVIKPFTELKIIELTIEGDRTLVNITQKGINSLQRIMNIPNEIYDNSTGKIVKGIKSENEVKIDPRFINHQIFLNQFVLDFTKMFNAKSFNYNFKYYDESYLSKYAIVRPDGLIRIGKLDLFLEEDTGTERSKQLSIKWNRYRRFLTKEFAKQDDNRKIVVLFILDCEEKSLKSRKLLIKRTIMEIFDKLLTNNFEIYIGTREELLNIVFNNIFVYHRINDDIREAFKKYNYKIFNGEKLKMRLDGTYYKYYLANMDSERRIKMFKPNAKREGVFLEFLGDHYIGQPLSVLSKIQYHNKNSHLFAVAYASQLNKKELNQRLIKYVVVVDNIFKLYDDLKACELLNSPGVLFTTIERLRKFKIERALFRFDTNSERILYSNDKFFEPLLIEGNLDEFDKNGIKNDKNINI